MADRDRLERFAAAAERYRTVSALATGLPFGALVTAGKSPPGLELPFDSLRSLRTGRPPRCERDPGGNGMTPHRKAIGRKGVLGEEVSHFTPVFASYQQFSDLVAGLITR